MGYEIDFMPVGSGERSGDAIAIRYGEYGAYTIHVVDGGTTEAGDAMVEHIREHYGNPSYIDHIVLTHGDDDHSSGLRKVIDEFNIGTIWMNRPWLYAAEIWHLFEDDRMTVESLERRLRDEFPILVEIEATAHRRNIPIYEAFQGAQIGGFIILSPTRMRYLDLIPQFTRTPEADREVGVQNGLAAALARAARRMVNWIVETWGHETLEEDVDTSASNETSVVQISNIDGRRVLMTGDAGVVSLDEAADYAELIGFELPGLHFMQVPHHGSRHNVSPFVLNRWLGMPVQRGEVRDIMAFVSAAEKSETHPRRKVVNAFIRRGATVIPTKGTPMWHYYNMPGRANFSPVMPLEFSDQVEE